MTRLTGRAALVLGAITLTVGLANTLAPHVMFPSRATCVHDWDLLMCSVEPWPLAPWLTGIGTLMVAVALAMLASRHRNRRGSSETTR